jgi:hypothetical protein
MFTAKQPPSAMTRWVFVVLSRQTSTSGGSSETSVNAETVIPWMRSPARAVTIATPVALRA